MKKHVILWASMVLFVFGILVFPNAPQAAPYYEGKILRMIVGFTPGGGYDRMTRLLARHLPKHIPGKPSVIVENMEGASSIIASNYLYNIAKPDGLTIGTFNRALPFAQVIKLDGVKFDIRKYSWIGSTAVEGTVLTLRTDLPYKTVEDLRKVKEPIPLGCSGAGTLDYQFPLLLKEFVGLNLKMVIYVSSAETMLAVEKKEVDGRAGSYSSLRPFIERKVVRPWIRGRVSERGIENVPVNEDLATDKKGKAILAMFSAADLIGRPYVAPPGTPAEVMKILKEAFAKVCKDPQLKEESKKAMMEVDYTPAEEIMKVINFTFNQPEDIIKEFSKYVKF
ncbi:MAG: Bug family tripartite tricarboxylate transporter substrate binding protein [Thermodesulfobacteriota bacterium]